MAKDFSTKIVIGGKLNPSLQKAFSSAGKIAKKTASGLGKVGLACGKALAGIGAAAGGAALTVGAAAAKVVGGFLESADGLEKMRAQTGLTYDQLQKLQYIGGQLSVSMDSITTAASAMNKSMASAKSGTGDTAAAYAALGVKFKDVTTGALRPQSEVFNESLVALSNMKNASERNAIAYKVFGKGAKDLIPLMDAGSGEISRLSKEAEKLGLVLSDDTISAGDQFGDTLEKLKNIGQSIGGKLAGGLLPVLQKMADIILANAPQITALVSDIGGALGDALTSILPSLLPLIQQLLPVAANLLKSLLPVIPPIASFISGLIPLIMPIVNMLAPFITQFVQTMLPALMEVAQALLPVLLELLQAFMPILKPLLDILAAIITLIGKGLADAIKFVMPAIKWIADVIGKVANGVSGFIGGVKKFFGGSEPTEPNNPSTPNYPSIPGSPYPGFARGGFTNRPSVFGEDGPEVAIPIKRTPRSLSLLNQTAGALGAKPGGTQIIYAPQIIGGNKAETEAALKVNFEQFKAWFKQLQIEEGALNFE
jgi:hypothetical protein